MPTRAILLAALSSPALAVPVQLTVSTAQSDVSGQVCITPALIGQRCDTFDTSVVGFINVELDSPSPTTIAINDFDLAFTDDVLLTYSWGFLGSISLTLTDAAAIYATPGTPTTPAAIDGLGNFIIAPVSTLLTGTGTSSGSILGQPANQTINLADNGPADSAFAGTLSITGQSITISFESPFDLQAVDPLATIDLTGSITFIATGTLPDTCPADLTGDGTVDSGDLAAFITAFISQDPSADLTNDGTVDSGDLAAFISLFLAGCP
jgi:hypothetical protein